MSLNDACRKIQNKFPAFDIVRVNDYRNFWIFVLAPKGKHYGYNDGCYSVNKKTGNIAYFVPNYDMSYFEEAKQVM